MALKARPNICWLSLFCLLSFCLCPHHSFRFAHFLMFFSSPILFGPCITSPISSDLSRRAQACNGDNLGLLSYCTTVSPVTSSFPPQEKVANYCLPRHGAALETPIRAEHCKNMPITAPLLSYIFRFCYVCLCVCGRQQVLLHYLSEY